MSGAWKKIEQMYPAAGVAQLCKQATVPRQSIRIAGNIHYPFGFAAGYPSYETLPAALPGRVCYYHVSLI